MLLKPKYDPFCRLECSYGCESFVVCLLVLKSIRVWRIQMIWQIPYRHCICPCFIAESVMLLHGGRLDLKGSIQSIQTYSVSIVVGSHSLQILYCFILS